MITTNVVGDLFVIMDPNGELETTVGGQVTLDWIQIYTMLRVSFGDHYDFMSCYLDVASGVQNLGDASVTIYQDASGIGRWTAANGFNSRADWGTARLQHFAYYSFFSVTAMLHEIGHRWLAYVNYTNTPGGTAQHLLHEDWIWSPGQQNVHWGRWLDDQNSCMDYDQAEWIANINGTFGRIDREPSIAAQDEWFGYSPLDQYLMGFLPPTDVPAFKVVQNPSPALSELGPYGVLSGPYTPNPSATTVTITQVQNTRSDEPAPWSGSRNPSHLNSQRVFHEASVVITKDTSLSSAFITNSDNWRRRYTTSFRRATAGRGMVDTSLLRANYTGLYVKDNPADMGAVPSSAPFWLSPDLWVRNADDGLTIDQPAIRNQSNWIYGRVRNKSVQPYQNVTVNFYLANFAGTQFLYPVDWRPTSLIGTATISSVPAASGGVEGTAIAKIEWPAALVPPATGWHPCLLSEVIPMEVAPTGLHYVFDNPKLAQRNISVIDPSLMALTGGGGGGRGPARNYIFTFEFSVGHPLQPATTTRIDLRAERHQNAVKLFLDPAGLVKDIETESTILDWGIPLDAARVPSGHEGIRQFEGDPVPSLTEHGIGLSKHIADGITVGIPSGTQFEMLSDPEQRGSAFNVRFENDVRVRIGRRVKHPFEKRYGLRGMRPVVLNGIPLLEVTDVENASIVLPLDRGDRTPLRIIGVVLSGGRESESALYHLSEHAGDRVLGGVTLELKT